MWSKYRVNYWSKLDFKTSTLLSRRRPYMNTSQNNCMSYKYPNLLCNTTLLPSCPFEEMFEHLAADYNTLKNLSNLNY